LAGLPVVTHGAGLSSRADEPTVTEMMEIAGDIDITFKRVDAPVLVGKTVEDAVGFKLTIGPAGEVFRGAGAEAKRTEFKAAMATAINAQKNDADGIIMDSRARIRPKQRRAYITNRWRDLRAWASWESLPPWPMSSISP
jgi:hypothetical protein